MNGSVQEPFPSRTIYFSGSLTMPISTIIVDDEQLSREELSYLLKSVGDVEVVAQGSNGVEAIHLIREHNPELVFLDVQMPGLDGFGVIKKLVDKKHPLPQIVFATAFDQYAVRAFEVNAVDYLLKPFDKKRVAQSVEKAKQKLAATPTSSERLESLINLLEQQQKPQQQKILLRSAGRLILIDQKDICFATIDEGVITVASSNMEGHSNCRKLDALNFEVFVDREEMSDLAQHMRIDLGVVPHVLVTRIALADG